MGYKAKPQTTEEKILNNIFIMDMINIPQDDKLSAVITLKIRVKFEGEEQALRDYKGFVNDLINITMGN